VNADAVGHYRNSAGALAFMGALGLVIGGIDRFLMPQELGFISGNAIFAFSLLFLAVAAWMASRQVSHAIG
jgi:hypothetical protein